MDVTLVEGHPRIEEVRNQVAIKRGPVVYCIESPGLPAETDVLDVYVPADVEFEAEHRPDLLGGMTTIRGKLLLRTDKKKGMYRSVSNPSWESVRAELVPYYAWCNRGECEMTVWMPVVWE